MDHSMNETLKNSVEKTEDLHRRLQEWQLLAGHFEAELNALHEIAGGQLGETTAQAVTRALTELQARTLAAETALKQTQELLAAAGFCPFCPCGPNLGGECQLLCSISEYFWKQRGQRRPIDIQREEIEARCALSKKD